MGTEAEVAEKPSESTKTEEEEEKEDDFCIECSDDEDKYNPTKKEKGFWEPDPKDIVTLYEKLSKGEVFELKWEWALGRRSPSPERMEEDEDADKDANEGQADEEMEEEKPAEKTEFDFDDAFSEVAAKVVTPRRTPGNTKSPRSQKRVARLDKIMSDIMRHKKLDEEEAAARRVVKDKSSAEATPQRPPPKLKIRRDLLK